MYNCLPSIEGAVALTQRNPQKALDLLADTARFGVSLPLHSVYLRGQAYLALGQASQAAAQFRTIIDHSGLVLNDPLLNLAQIHLAKAYALAGEQGRAQETLQEVKQHWSGTEESFPALQQLRLEIQTP